MIEVNEWDDLVIETYGKPYNFQQQDGCKERSLYHFSLPMNGPSSWEYENDSIPETLGSDMGVSFKAWLARDPKQELNAEDWKSPSAITMWWERNFYPNVDMIANDLHKRGLLPSGDYVINIDW